MFKNDKQGVDGRNDAVRGITVEKIHDNRKQSGGDHRTDRHILCDDNGQNQGRNQNQPYDIVECEYKPARRGDALASLHF